MCQVKSIKKALTTWSAFLEREPEGMMGIVKAVYVPVEVHKKSAHNEERFFRT